ncbi:cation channel sperm-associated auxiliary subunit epsilon-like [Corticium candelabrum]|uniref:cation channel sperm-associated auxiliary subunit epsilon-like n=1 Tax=Corticium candelabrum TaxID=121492 RepID=UPI002E266280|nr:cation channel sperm-associated auxiliary subunit epsilon-like [Corticium candelabrum]
MYTSTVLAITPPKKSDALRSHPTLRVASSQIIRLETFPFDDDVFHYRIPFVVYFDFQARAGALNATWSIPDDCTIQKRRSATSNVALEVLCSQPGDKLITLKQNDSFSETTRVTLVDSLDCYSWYAAAESNQERRYANGSWSTVLRVWIVDHRHSTDEERLHNILLPSEHSETLTFQYYSLGEEPHLQLMDIAYSNHLEIKQSGFNTSTGVWQFLLVSLSGEVPLVVRGNDVIILGCGIRDGVLLLSFGRVVVPSLSLASTTILTTGKSKLIQHQQELNIGVYILKNGTYLSNSYFKTFEELRLPSQHFSSRSVDDATFLDKNLLLLISSDVYVIDLEGGFVASLTSLDASVDRIQAVSLVVRGAIDGTSSLQLSNAAVAVWNGKNQSDRFLLSMDGGLTFSTISLPLSASSLLIWSIGFHPFSPVVALLVASHKSKTKSVFYYFQYSNNQWEPHTSHEFLLGFDSEVTQPDFAWFPRGSGEMLLWDSSRVYYSTIAGRSGSLLRFIRGPYLNDEQLILNEFISEVHAALDGTFVILTTIKRLFVGHAGTEHVLLVTTVAHPDSYVSLAFDSSSRLLLVIAQSSYHIKRHYLPLRQLIQNSLQRNSNCPYIHWSSNFPLDLYYVDMNEILQLWSYLVPKAWKSNELTILVSDFSILNVTIESAEQLATTQGIIVRNETILLFENAALSSQSESGKIVSIKIMPANSSLLCFQPREAVSHLILGCPPYRIIKIHLGNDENSDYCKSYMNYEKSSSRQPKYNYSVYGCPLRVKYHQTFLPSLDLYDRDAVVDSVAADFILIDELGNSGLSYTHTAREVGCLRTPEWLKQLQARSTVNFTVPAQGYHSCFNSSVDVSSDDYLDEAYLLLNSSSPNRLRLSSGDGLYLFTAKIIANGYSYCNLETRFAVKIYGTPFRSVAGYAVLGTCCLVGIGALIIVYYVQRHEIRKRSSADKDK